MRTYELFCVLPGTLAETDVLPLVQQVEQIVVKEGGVDVAVTDLGKSRLAYPMRHIRYGYFRVCRFQADPGVALRVRAGVGLLDGILRAMLFHDDGRARASRTAGITIQPVDRVGLESFPQTEIHAAPPAVEIKVEIKKPAESDERAPQAVPFEDIDKQLDKLLEKDIAGV